MRSPRNRSFRGFRGPQQPQIVPDTARQDIPTSMTEEAQGPTGARRTRTPMENQGIYGDRPLGPGDRRTSDPKNCCTE
jgi:hypothetical protein